MTLAQMKQHIAEKAGLDSWSDWKVISRGKTLTDRDDDKTLRTLGFKNDTRIMITSASAGRQQLAADETAQSEGRVAEKKVEQILNTAAELARRQDAGTSARRHDYFASLETTSGEVINIPKQVEENLKLAMTLDAKAREIRSSSNEETARVLLEKARGAIEKVPDEFRNMIDNDVDIYLDLAWCYFKKQELSRLDDFEQALAKAETKLQRMEKRDRGDKAEMAARKAKKARLLLLQCVVAFFKDRKMQAAGFLNDGIEICDEFNVREEQMAYLQAMGYQFREAKRSLRAVCGRRRLSGDFVDMDDPTIVQEAIEFIYEMREKRSELNGKNREKHQLMLKQKRLGKCRDGSWVNMTLLQQFTLQKYPEKDVVRVLQKTNNDPQETERMLQEEALSKSMLESAVEAMVGMGVDAERARAALQLTSNNSIDEAMTIITTQDTNSQDSVPPAAAAAAAAASESSPSPAGPPSLDFSCLHNPLPSTNLEEWTGNELCVGFVCACVMCCVATRLLGGATLAMLNTQWNLTPPDIPPDDDDDGEEVDYQAEQLNEQIEEQFAHSLRTQSDPYAYLDIDLSEERAYLDVYRNTYLEHQRKFGDSGWSGMEILRVGAQALSHTSTASSSSGPSSATSAAATVPFPMQTDDAPSPMSIDQQPQQQQQEGGGGGQEGQDQPMDDSGGDNDNANDNGSGNAAEEGEGEGEDGGARKRHCGEGKAKDKEPEDGHGNK